LGVPDYSDHPTGNWFFLEINPNGQWGWIENEVGYPISKAIAANLLSSGQTDYLDLAISQVQTPTFA
jgi:hypothetical protein